MMEIRKNTFAPFAYFKGKDRTQDEYLTKPYPCDSFVKTEKAKRLSLNELLDKPYNILNEKEKDFIRNKTESHITEAANECISAANLVKEKYDNDYGEGNWAYVSIGRSCSTISQALSCMGIETYNIPISNLTSLNSGKNLINYTGFEDYKDYIYNLGLNPDRIKNSDKTFIFQDYCSTGTSLERFKEFIQSDEMGLDLENVKIESINSVYKNLFEENVNAIPLLKYVDYRMGSQFSPLSAKNYSNIPKLPYTELENIKNIKNYKPNQEVKLFNFTLHDAINSNDA